MKYLVLSISILFSLHTFSQNVLNSDSPEELRKLRDQKKDVKLVMKVKGDSIVYSNDTVSTKNTPLDYGFIEDKDILWSKVTWEIIDLNEKINQIYYHSSDGLVSANQSLFEAITQGITSGEINQIYDDEFFENKITMQDALGRLQDQRIDEDGLQDIKDQGEVVTAEDSLRLSDTYQIRNEKVRMLMIKGIWYIDKRLGEMKYRLLGMAVMGPDAKTAGKGIASGDELLPLFWIWYKNARPVLASYTIFNPNNNSSPITYDDMLNARRFSSIIYKSDSQFADGNIKEYLPKDAKAQLEESNRIKHEILQLENEMWNY